MLKEHKTFFFEIVETFIISLLVLFILFSLVAFPTLVWGSSMEPNFYTGERVLVDRLSKLFVKFQRGDVVVLHPPNDENSEYIKRIIGLPGDIIKIYDCKVYILQNADKYVLDEPYLNANLCTVGGNKIKDGRSLLIPAGYYVVLGDNRYVSYDSRNVGLISHSEILGKVVLRFWPLAKFSVI